jgi:hypothetical protein
MGVTSSSQVEDLRLYFGGRGGEEVSGGGGGGREGGGASELDEWRTREVRGGDWELGRSKTIGGGSEMSGNKVGLEMHESPSRKDK